jgi:hypothetical protein
VTVVLVAAGAVISYLALRGVPATPATPAAQPVPIPAEPELAEASRR